MFTGRRYFVWSEEEARVVREYFKDYINDTEHEGTKGHLPGNVCLTCLFDTYYNVMCTNNLGLLGQTHKVCTEFRFTNSFSGFKFGVGTLG